MKDYPGPYKATDEQQAEFDKAVSCDDTSITFRFNKPWADFPLAAASLMMTDPYKEEFDEGAKSQWKVLSNGPYKIESGKWEKNKGATLVRNEEYDAATDSPEFLRLGDFRTSLPAYLLERKPPAVFIHADVGSANRVASTRLAADLAPAWLGILAPGAYLACDQQIDLAGLEELPLPGGVVTDNYHFYRRVG